MDFLAKEKILCVFPDTWDDLKRGRHHIISRLLPYNEILIIEAPTMSLLSILREKKRIRRLWSWLSVRNPEKNLQLYTPLLTFPFIYKHKLLHRISEIVLRINIWIMLKFIGFKPTLLYLSVPSFDGFIKRFGIKRSLYIAHDAWEVYPDGQHIMKYEEMTLKKVDLAIFNAKPNMLRKAHLNRKSYYVPHGCPSSGAIISMQNKPHDFPKTGELFLGYWGAIDKECVDVELLLWLSGRHPEWTFVLIGPIYERDKKVFFKLKERKNISFLGHKNNGERYKYLSFFDIALLCACPNEVELKASQLKFWEYVAIGLPIVGIPVEEYVDYEWFYAARSELEWEEMILRASKENTPGKKAQRIEFARSNTWEKRVQQISDLVREVIPNNRESL